MSVIHAPREPDLDLRHIVTLCLIGAALLVLVLRLWVLQVVRHEELVEKAEAYRQSAVTKLAPRGLIVDRKGRLLAGVKPQIIITAVPQTVRRQPWVIDKVATILKADAEKLRDMADRGFWRPYLPTPIFIGAGIQEASRIAEAGEFLPGIGVDTQAMRYYTDSKTLSHVLGYVWTPDERDVKRLKEDGLDVPDYVGKLGLEYVYEGVLMGTEGRERVEVDVKRRPIRVLGRDNPIPGAKLVLSIDTGLQAKALQLLKGRKGAVVMMDPKSGEVLCLASSPTFDASLFEGGITQKDYAKLRDDKRAPLVNRAIRGFYSPGSTFKIVTSMASQSVGEFSPNRTVVCRGYYQIGTRRLRCLGVHGAISYRRALAKSCNTYFASMGVDAGEEALSSVALAVGLGSQTGIDVRGEGKGIVPTKQWMAEHRDPPRWYGGDTANMAIGQGFLSVTPLQMCSVASLVANRGVGYRPHLVRTIIAPGKNGKTTQTSVEEIHRFEAPDSFWEAMTVALNEALEDGTGARALIPGIPWCGKTGSTEHIRGRKTHGWFVGFAPMRDPKVAISVLVEESGHGGEVSAPIARELVKAYLAPETSATTSSNARRSPPTVEALESSPTDR